MSNVTVLMLANTGKKGSEAPLALPASRRRASCISRRPCGAPRAPTRPFCAATYCMFRGVIWTSAPVNQAIWMMHALQHACAPARCACTDMDMDTGHMCARAPAHLRARAHAFTRRHTRPRADVPARCAPPAERTSASSLSLRAAVPRRRPAGWLAPAAAEGRRVAACASWLVCAKVPAPHPRTTAQPEARSQASNAAAHNILNRQGLEPGDQPRYCKAYAYNSMA